MFRHDNLHNAILLPFMSIIHTVMGHRLLHVRNQQHPPPAPYLWTLRGQGLSAEEITTVKESASEIRVERDVTEERQHPLLQKRNGLTYGRLFIDRSASSFEVRPSVVPSCFIYSERCAHTKSTPTFAVRENAVGASESSLSFSCKSPPSGDEVRAPI